jgi:hypothetical protein
MGTTVMDYFKWLEFFYEHADFGPAHDDVVNTLKEEFEEETGLKAPEETY